MTGLWQPHYELRDHEIVDYRYWELPETGIQFRGPAVDFDDPAPYFACAGAAQTFGCFVADPYPALLGARLGLQAVNLGLGSATPDIFSDERLLQVINGGRFLVLQVMAARQCSNSRLHSLGTDLVHDRRHGDDIPAHMAWRRILDEERPNLERYIAESQASWIDQYEKLLRQIHVPVIYFYFSVKEKGTDPPMDAETAQALLEPFPQLVRGASIDTVAAQCGEFIACTSIRNHGHPLTSRFSGEPVEVDNSVLDPRMTVRWKRNWYYPSPEMHEDAATSLFPAAAELAGLVDVSPPDGTEKVHDAAERTVSTFCRICEARCGIDVTVREGRVVRIGPDKRNPYSWKDFCSKGRSAGEVVHHPRRLLTPLRRVDGSYEPATWEEAVDDIASRLSVIRDRHGPDAIASYLGNPVGFNGSNGAWFASLVRGLGTANTYSVSSVDQNNLQRVCHEMYGRWLVPLVPDVDECDYFLLVGMNPAVSTFGWIHNVPDGWRRTLARQADGATIVLVDPNHTESTAKSDRHVRVWPGQDWALLLGVLVTILREGLARTPPRPVLAGMDELERLVREADVAELAARCRVSVDTITSIAREFAAARTAMCVAHTGVSHSGEGVLAEWLSHVLNAVTGRLDAVGGRRFEPGYTPVGGMFGTRPARPSRVRGLPAIAGARSLAELADEITTPGEGQIKALICNSGNPVLSGAQGARLDDALAGLDLMVAVDLVQRESHRHAHWLLPAAHYLEREDLLSVYSSFEDQPFVQFAQAALEPPPGVRQEWTFWRDLAVALDIPIFGPQTASMTPRHLWQTIVDGGGRLSWRELLAQPHGVIYGAKSYGQLESAIATPDGAVHLAPEAFLARLRHLLAIPEAEGSSDWPILLSNQRRKSAMNSWLNDTPTALRRNVTNTLLLHPDDAAPLGIATGDTVRVSSRVHALECTAEVSEAPQAGVAVLDHGWGSRLFDPQNREPSETHGANRNALVSDQDVDVLSGTPSFGTTRVRVERLAAAVVDRR